jgi:hypothetical protein
MEFSPAHLRGKLLQVLEYVQTQDMDRAVEQLAEISEVREMAMAHQMDFGATGAQIRELRLIERQIAEAMKRFRGELLHQMKGHREVKGAMHAYSRMARAM